MATAPRFKTTFDPAHGAPVACGEGIVRVTARNGGAFTFHGTNSYIIGEREVAVLDPGPQDSAHLEALLAAIGNRPVRHILVSHTHQDHSPLAAALSAKTGAPVSGAAPHHTARPLHLGEINALDASADRDYAPDRVMADGETVDVDGLTIEAVSTPGHTANHLSFAVRETGVLFSADHVMAWATSIVAPPDGSMREYMASLDRLLKRGEHTYLPGHGGPVEDPLPFVRGLKAHRKMRERAILDRITKGDRLIAEMVREIYRDTDPRLHGAAALSVFAHLEDLVERGAVRTEGAPSLASSFVAV